MTYLIIFLSVLASMILIVALYPVVAVLLAWLVLIGFAMYEYVKEKLKSLLERTSVLFFRAMSIGGLCSVTLLTALGLCASEKKDLDKSDSDKK
jgi:hypothetical protein